MARICMSRAVKAVIIYRNITDETVRNWPYKFGIQCRRAAAHPLSARFYVVPKELPTGTGYEESDITAQTTNTDETVTNAPASKEEQQVPSNLVPAAYDYKERKEL